MIRYRKNPFSDETSEYPFVEGEVVFDLVGRVLDSEGFSESPEIVDVTQVVFNGHILEKDFWHLTKVNESDSVLVCPKISRGSGGQLFKTLAILAVSIVASVYLSPAVGGGLYGALAAAGATITASLIINSLIPPPGLPGLGGGSSDPESSQMYTITSQSNAAKKFGFVPKVYGTHRIFPVVVVAPYTEIEADPGTGVLVQYFYGIYDFGFGPMTLTDFKIGDTAFEDYADLEYRLVDLNAPDTDEGIWDNVTNIGPSGTKVKDFLLYKGDNENDGTTVAIDKNQEDGGPADGYEFVRNASAAVNDSDQEIVLDFTTPNGLIAYGTTGNSFDRVISLDIQFSKVNADPSLDEWHPFNDLNYVYNYTASGATQSATYTSFVNLRPYNNESQAPTGYYKVLETQLYEGYDSNGQPSVVQTSFMGLPGPSVTSIDLGTGDANIGDSLFMEGNLIGEVASIIPSSGGYSTYVFKTPYQGQLSIYFVVNGQAFSGSSGSNQTPWNNRIVRKYSTFGGAIISGRTTSPVYATFSFKPIERAQYKVRVRRISTRSTQNYQVQDRLTLINLRTKFNRNPILTEKRHTFLEIKVRATNQLSGALQNLSAVATSVLDVWDGTNWIKKATSNPAWVYTDLLTGTVNPKPVPKSRLHLPSIVEWANFCDEIPLDPPGPYTYNLPRFQSNFILDFDTTLQAMINTVTNACQGSMNLTDGKYGILVDQYKDIPVQIFTPRNSWNFSSQRGYSESPNSLKVKYIDASSGSWDVSEAIVYDDGFDADTAITSDELTSFGCTNYIQAWRFGRYMMAQAKLRRETISISVDFEHLVCTRGDFVQISQDVMKVGGTPMRVKTVSGIRITTDDSIETIGGADYGYVFRSAQNGIKTSTLTVINASTFDLDGSPMPQPGDLIIVGEVGKIVIDCLVKSITAESNLAATLVLVEKADAIYEAEYSATIPPYNPNLNTTISDDNGTPGPVENLHITDNTYRVLGSDYQYYIGTDWDVPTGSAYELFEIYVDSGGGYNLWDTTQESFYEYIVDPKNLGVPHKFKVLAVSANGKKINLIEAPEVTATPLPKTARPSDVEALYINITDQVIALDWTGILDEDLKEYIIRYSPLATGASWEASIPLVRVDRKTVQASTQGRTGTYLIKASDFNNNESLNAAIAITSIPNLFDLNVIEETDDFPALTGDKVNTEVDAASLIISRAVAGGIETNEYYPVGYYYYQDFLDLGDVYTVRLQSQIQAEGYTVGDLMSNWVTLDSVEFLSNAKQSEWDVETQYRTTNVLNVMADWVTLSDVDPISEGDQDNWTPWRKFTIGDATGRIFQFRLKLISNLASVTPRVFSGVVKSDMPDRVFTLNNLISPPGGLIVNYTPAFKGPTATGPNIQITQDASESGDKVLITERTIEGFKIEFFDENGDPVTRQFDVSVKGYGRRALTSI